jgi:hypothetical protein
MPEVSGSLRRVRFSYSKRIDLPEVTLTMLDRRNSICARPRHLNKTSRRQNQSCDRCRHAKRACDAGERGPGYFSFSNCTRTGKKCTSEKLRGNSRSIPTKSAARNPRTPARLNNVVGSVVDSIVGSPPTSFNRALGQTLPAQAHTSRYRRPPCSQSGPVSVAEHLQQGADASSWQAPLLTPE